MYATTTVAHQPMPDDIKVKPYCGRVSAFLGDLYLNFTPDEADRLAAELTRAAAECRAKKGVAA